MKKWSDDQLYEKCVSGHAQGWEELIRRYGSVVYGAICYQIRKMGYSKRLEIADDIFQGCFCAILEKKSLNRLKNKRALRSYLAACAIKQTIDYFRAENTADKYFWNAGDMAGVSERQGISLGESLPKRALEDRELRQNIDSALEEMTVQEEFILRLDLMHDMKQSLIADLMHLPENTVASIVRRSKEKLRKILEEKGYSL